MLAIAFALSKAAVKNEKRSGIPYLMFCIIFKEKHFNIHKTSCSEITFFSP